MKPRFPQGKGRDYVLRLEMIDGKLQITCFKEIGATSLLGRQYSAYYTIGEVELIMFMIEETNWFGIKYPSVLGAKMRIQRFKRTIVC